jgi:hypothetical protein
LILFKPQGSMIQVNPGSRIPIRAYRYRAGKPVPRFIQAIDLDWSAGHSARFASTSERRLRDFPLKLQQGRLRG